MSLTIVLAVLLAQSGDPEARLYQGPGKVDAEPFALAIAGRFFECLQQEGVSIPADQTVVIHRSLRQVGTILARANPDGDCLTSTARVNQCAARVARLSCSELHTVLIGGGSGAGQAQAPAWARAYADAISNKITTCFQEETSGALNSESQSDLQAFTRLLSLAFGAIQGLCKVKKPEFDICLSVTQAISCRELSALLSDQPANAVELLMQSCGGIFDCNFGRDR